MNTPPNFLNCLMTRAVTFAITMLASACGAIAIAQENEVADDRPIERWDRAMCLVSPHPPAEGKEHGTTELGSAFLVKTDDAIHLVSAAQCAKLTNAQTKIFYRKPTGAGASRWVTLKAITANAGEPWEYHKLSDLATMKLNSNAFDDHLNADFPRIAFPIQALSPANPMRTTPIEITGFPIGIGVTPTVSPLVMPGHVASREIPTKSKWGLEPIIYATPAAGGGCGGGPVFEFANNPFDVRIVGMFVGIAADKTGAKLSKLVPAHVIRDVFLPKSEVVNLIR